MLFLCHERGIDKLMANVSCSNKLPSFPSLLDLGSVVSRLGISKNTESNLPRFFWEQCVRPFETRDSSENLSEEKSEQSMSKICFSRTWEAASSALAPREPSFVLSASLRPANAFHKWWVRKRCFLVIDAQRCEKNNVTGASSSTILVFLFEPSG